MRFILALLLALACAAPAAADNYPAQIFPITVSNTQQNIKYGPGIFYGGITTTTQLAPLQCWDSLTINSGTKLSAVILVVSTTPGLFSVPPSGVRFSVGLTCNVPGTITGHLNVMYR